MLYYKKTGETSSFCFILCPIPRIIPHYSHKNRERDLIFKKSSFFLCTFKFKHYLCVAIEGNNPRLTYDCLVV